MINFSTFSDTVSLCSSSYFNILNFAPCQKGSAPFLSYEISSISVIVSWCIFHVSYLTCPFWDLFTHFFFYISRLLFFKHNTSNVFAKWGFSRTFYLTNCKKCVKPRLLCWCDSFPLKIWYWAKTCKLLHLLKLLAESAFMRSHKTHTVLQGQVWHKSILS